MRLSTCMNGDSILKAAASATAYATLQHSRRRVSGKLSIKRVQLRSLLISRLISRLERDPSTRNVPWVRSVHAAVSSSNRRACGSSTCFEPTGQFSNVTDVGMQLSNCRNVSCCGQNDQVSAQHQQLVVRNLP